MNKILFTLVTILFIASDKNELDFFEYHQKFVEVENLIGDENFKDAEAELEPLLLKYKPNFTKDYVIMAQLCLLNNHKSNAFDWIKESMKHGAKTKCLKDIKILDEKISKLEWEKIESESKDLKAIYLSNISYALGKRFNINYQKEQDSKRKKNYKSVVYANFGKIKALTDKGTFPGEYLIGIDNKDYAPKISECEFGNSKVIVTLLHYDYPIAGLTEDALVTAIRKGQLHPRQFAYIFTYSKNRISTIYDSSYKDTEALPNYNFKFAFEKREADVNKVNEDRRKFTICSVESDKKKRLVEEKYGMKLTFGYQ